MILVDLLCHGAASPGLFSDHVAFLESRYGHLTGFEFRNKDFGWHGYRNAAVFDGDGKRFGYDVSAYQEVFNFSYAARPACASCPYATSDRVGDFTLGDYWGVELHRPHMDDDKGVSLVIVSSDRAKEVLGRFGGMMVNELEMDEYTQGVLNHPCPASKDRKSFWSTYASKGYVAALRRFTSFGLLRRTLRSARHAVREALKR